MMMPSLAALFTNPTWELRSHLGPVFGSFCEHNLAKESILGFRPRSPDQLAAATQLQISLVALDFRFSELFTNSVPGAFAKLCYKFAQAGVLNKHIIWLAIIDLTLT